MCAFCRGALNFKPISFDAAHSAACCPRVPVSSSWVNVSIGPKIVIHMSLRSGFSELLFFFGFNDSCRTPSYADVYQMDDVDQDSSFVIEHQVKLNFFIKSVDHSKRGDVLWTRLVPLSADSARVNNAGNVCESSRRDACCSEFRSHLVDGGMIPPYMKSLQCAFPHFWMI